jgi:uncharacterized protein YodC (DUF2158 family)
MSETTNAVNVVEDDAIITIEPERHIFTVGDVVMLRSGGVQMIVAHVFRDGECRCVWHNHAGDAQHDRFPEACLVRA